MNSSIYSRLHIVVTVMGVREVVEVVGGGRGRGVSVLRHLEHSEGILEILNSNDSLRLHFSPI